MTPQPQHRSGFLSLGILSAGVSCTTSFFGFGLVFTFFVAAFFTFCFVGPFCLILGQLFTASLDEDVLIWRCCYVRRGFGLSLSFSLT